MLDLNHKSSSAHASATTKKNTPPNQNSQGNKNKSVKYKKNKGPVTKLLTCETVPIIKHICTKL